MDAEEALNIAQKAVFTVFGRYLTSVEQLVLREAWNGATYSEIAAKFNYSDRYLSQDVGPALWDLLSEALGEPITKRNLQAAVSDYSQQLSEIQLPTFTIRRTPRTGQGYIEPLLDIGTAIPLHMVLIPGGSFTMGSPDDEPERDKERESPQHEVTVPPFFMGRYPVTQAQWRAVVELPPTEQDWLKAQQKLYFDPSKFKGDNRPVEQVSWEDATEFCRRLSLHTGRPYRLPTEAEWEYTCRAGTTTPFYFGKTLTDELANYNASYTYADGPKGEYREETTPVDHFGIANAFGLSDMYGNVWEWCQDHWHDNHKGAPADGSAWLDVEADENAKRVMRGGSWVINPRNCRSASRYNDDPRNTYDSIGFRVCCSAPTI